MESSLCLVGTLIGWWPIVWTSHLVRYLHMNLIAIVPWQDVTGFSAVVCLRAVPNKWGWRASLPRPGYFLTGRLNSRQLQLPLRCHLLKSVATNLFEKKSLEFELDVCEEAGFYKVNILVRESWSPLPRDGYVTSYLRTLSYTYLPNTAFRSAVLRKFSRIMNGCCGL